MFELYQIVASLTLTDIIHFELNLSFDYDIILNHSERQTLLNRLHDCSLLECTTHHKCWPTLVLMLNTSICVHVYFSLCVLNFTRHFTLHDVIINCLSAICGYFLCFPVFANCIKINLAENALFSTSYLIHLWNLLFYINKILPL